MDKKNELIEKLNKLIFEIDAAKKIVDLEKSNYLNNYKNGINAVIIKLENNELPASKGGPIDAIRGISEYDSLASIQTLYNAACDVDIFYSKECREW